MDDRANFIGVKHVRVGALLVAVELFRNDGGSVAARCLLEGGERPIIDADTPEEAMAAVEESLDGLLYARAAAARSVTGAPPNAATGPGRAAAGPHRRVAAGER